jgi:CheY-like chemotaxis protein
MSHEIRGPLAAILGYGERALLHDSATERMREALLTTQRSGKHLLGIVNDVLDASQLDAGQTVIRWEEVEPWTLSEEVMSIMAVNSQGKSLHVYRTALTALPTRVRTDPLRLKQILLNLLGNAIKFTEAGEVELRLGASPEHRSWWMEVRDTGIGMSAEQLGRLFQPYQQAGSDTVRRYGGSGLGLYISRELASRLGGQIQVMSTPGQGSTFRVEFPVGVACEWEWPNESTVALTESASASLPKLQGRVLLADDDPDLRHLEAALLQDFGLAVTTAADGSAALRAALRERFEVIILDMHMPELDGLATTRALRKAGVDAPVVAMTADAVRETAEAWRDAGAHVVLTKPVDRRLLHDHLRRWLPLARVTPPSNRQRPPELAQVLAAARERFRARAEGEVSELRGMAAARDLSALGQRLHRLKGTAGFLEHHALVAALADVEQKIQADREQVDAAVEQVVEQLLAL